MSEKKQLVWMRGLLVVFIAISALIALFQYHSSVVFIAQLMGYSWGALAGSFLGPLPVGVCIPGAFRRRACGARSPWVGLTAVNMGWRCPAARRLSRAPSTAALCA